MSLDCDIPLTVTWLSCNYADCCTFLEVANKKNDDDDDDDNYIGTKIFSYFMQSRNN